MTPDLIHIDPATGLPITDSRYPVPEDELVYGPARQLFMSTAQLPNAADTAYLQSSEYTLPAGQMANDGDRLVIEAIYSLSASSSNKTWVMAIGYSAFAAAVFTGGIIFANYPTTPNTSQFAWFRAMLTRTGATTMNTVAMINFSVTNNPLANPAAFQVGSAITWANANKISGAVKDSVGNAAAITLNQWSITYFPAAKDP